MKKTKAIITLGAIAFALSGCGASGGNPTTPTQANVAANVLQFAVGTANYSGCGTPSLNVVTTYRQPAGSFNPGASGVLVSTPTLTLPAAIAGPAGAASGYDITSTVLTGPATGEIGTDAITSTSQNPGTTTVTSFGQSGGVWSLGIEPWNSTSNGDASPPGANTAGTPFQVAPYPVPLYDAASATGTDPNIFVPWGGPPAFKYAGNPDSIVGAQNIPAGTAGVPEGIDVFESVAPAAGTYQLSVVIPGNTGTVTQTKSVTLGAVTCIPQAATPPFVADGTGGGTLAFVMPAGATEAFVQLTDFGPDSTVGTVNASAPVYYTIEATASGTLTLPDAIGPGGAPSTATGDDLVVQVVAFDYDLFGLSPLNSGSNPSPTITGAAGTDDLSVSAATCTALPAGPCTTALPLLKHRALKAAGLLSKR
ncbi:MAG: hypothetical protein WB491_12925 [Candidatus Aquilonibacter sp.]